MGESGIETESRYVDMYCTMWLLLKPLNSRFPWLMPQNGLGGWPTFPTILGTQHDGLLTVQNNTTNAHRGESDPVDSQIGNQWDSS